MSTTRKIAHNTIVQIIGKTISTFLGLIAIGMMTRYLGLEQFGWYVTVVSFLGFTGILIDLGLIPVTAQMMSEPTFNKKELFKNLLGFRFMTALIFFGLVPFAVLFFPYPIEVKIAIGFSTISFLGIAMNQVFVGFYQTKLKMHIQAIAEVVSRIVLIAGLFLFMTQKAPFLPIMGIIVIATITQTAVLWITASKESPVGFGFNLEIWKAIIKKSWPIAISIIFNVVYLKGDIIILSVLREQTEVGIYGAAYRVIEILSQTAMMIMGVILPILAYNWSHKNFQEFKKRYQQAFDIMMMLAIPMTIGTILTADKIMKLVGGEKFLVSGKPLQILAIAVFALYLGAIFGHAAVAINKQKQTMWIYISDAIITFIGYLIFIPLYGIWGAAWMTVFSEVYAGVLLFFTFQHYSKQKLAWKTFSKILLAGAVMGLSIILLINLHILLIVPIAAIVYAKILYLTGAVSKETIKEVIALKK